MALTSDRHERRPVFGAESKGSPEGTPGSSAREYLSVEQLAKLTPWSRNAIEKMVSRGVFKLGVHYFRPFGHRTQLLFKWSSIVGLIEGQPEQHSTSAAQDLLVKGPLDVAKAAENLGRLLRR